jgi:hypothetical protein
MADHTILCVHGIGSVESDPNWDQPWITAITNGFGAPQSGNNLQFATLAYDHLFEQFPAGAPQYLEAVAELLASAAWHTLTDPFRARGFGLPDIGKYAGRWYAGMVAQWVSEPDLRTACRQALAAEIERSNPDIICAHSLGTLLCYDLFSQDQQGPAVIAGRVFVTLGSQIGNTFVRAKAWGGRIPMINAVKWYHLFNHQDQAFTAEIQEPGIANFQEIFADSPAGHSPTNQGGSPGYLDHPNTISAVWHVLAKQPDKTIAARAIDLVQVTPQPKRRALLVGINKYPDPAHQLEGCVNDVYLVSSLLQENGFAAADIRIVVDERATREAILERFRWLLEVDQDGIAQTERVFYYSGHGVQIPSYGVDGKVDHTEDGLVPVDFDWQQCSAITDRDLAELYAQLPYDTEFLAIFDCCHSGGLVKSMHPAIRALPLPDDIRHRMQFWDKQAHAWKNREFAPLIHGLSKEDQLAYIGSNDATYKLGRAIPFRIADSQEYDRLRKEHDHSGPYLPIVFEACRENQSSYEYADGSIKNGAFTYTLAWVYRSMKKRGKDPSYENLIHRIGAELKKIGFDQTPQLVCPKKLRTAKIPGP